MIPVAAAELPGFEGSRVIVVDRGYRWGGHWPDQYSFCRLHTPSAGYTVGARQWSFAGSEKNPTAYRATRDEVLSHFRDIVEANVLEKQLDLVMLFGYEYRGHAAKETFTVIRQFDREILKDRSAGNSRRAGGYVFFSL